MKKILLSLGLVAALAPGMMAEKYEGLTTPMPASAAWAPENAAPGVYGELVGSYQCNIATAYNTIYATGSMFSSPAVWIVDENDEIVSTGTLKPMGMGTRYYNYFNVTVSEANAVRTPGKYYMIYPISNDPNASVQAIDYTTGQMIEIYNLKAGPYIVGEKGEPVDAEITVEPAGVYEQEEGFSYVTMTIGNVDPDMLNVGDLLSDEEGKTLITVTGPAGKLDMAQGEKEGNVIKWMFPLDNTGEACAMLPGGEYTISINYSSFSGYTAQLNPLTFPATGTYTFTVEGGLEKVVPEVVASPLAGEFENWTAPVIGLTLSDYKFNYPSYNELKNNAPELVLVDPDGETYTLPVKVVRSLNAVGYDCSAVDFTKIGTYNCYWKIDGYSALNSKTGNEVLLADVTISYVKPAPIPVVTPEVTQYSPAPQADAWKSNVTSLKLVGYTLVGTSSTEYPALVLTTPSGLEVSATAFRAIGGQYQYQLTGDWQSETGIFKAVWKLGGWTATDVEGETVKLNDVELTYLIGKPTEPETETNVGADVSPAPGTQKELSSITLVFGSDFISDFVSWTEEFNAKANVRNIEASMGTDYAPVLSADKTEVTYNLNISNEVAADYRVAINLWGQKYYANETARALKTAYVPEDKAWVVLDYTVDKETGIVSVEGEDASVIYFDLNGNRLLSAPEKGIYIRVNNGKAEKTIK